MSKNTPSNLQETQNKNEEVTSQEDYGQAMRERQQQQQDIQQ
ncbi:MAG: hypothetical protein ACXWT4_14405 [Methylobacter sp.]